MPIVLLILILLPFTVMADDAASLQQEVEQLKTLEASFTQRQISGSGQLQRESSGELALKRPGGLYWHYQKPHEQTLIAEDDVLWVYEPDLMQATRSRLSANQGAPIAILLDEQPIIELFTVRKVSRNEQSLRWFELTPKEAQGDFQSVLLGLDDSGLKEMIFVDQLGHRTEVVLSERRFNHSLDATRFAFEPPAGVDVVEGQSPAQP